jgi:exopolyphosphatase/pppGpp-phosphohydrolase
LRCPLRLPNSASHSVGMGWVSAGKPARGSAQSVDTLQAAAVVLYRVLRQLKPERVVFSVLGLREGWLYAQLDHEE